MRISDWSSDVCSSDLPGEREEDFPDQHPLVAAIIAVGDTPHLADDLVRFRLIGGMKLQHLELLSHGRRSEEHTSELQSLMRISYAVFCLKKKNTKNQRKQPSASKTYIQHTIYQHRSHG